MSQLLAMQHITVVLSVLLFVFLMIALLVIVDHKARIPGPVRDDLFSIVGQRRSHPIWAWLTSSLLLWATIAVLLVSWVWSVFAKVSPAVEPPKIVSKLDAERRSERLKHFHNMPATDPWSPGKRPVCFYCHGDFPHSKKPMVRTLLNMHTQFIGCHTCHFDETRIPEASTRRRWLNYSGVEVKGKPFGTDVDPKTGELLKTDDFFSKIVTYRMVDGKEQLLEIPEDEADAQEYLKVRDKLTELDRESVKKSFHKLVNPVGRFCSRCHAEESESFIPFRELGFSEKRIAAVTNVNIVGIVQKYREFYLPTMFEKGITDLKKETLLGAPHPISMSEEMKRDPRTWWANSFQPPTKAFPAAGVGDATTSGK